MRVPRTVAPQTARACEFNVRTPRKTMKRKIQELLDLNTGEELNADKWLGSLDESQQFELRRKLKKDYKENAAHIVCATCSSPVYLAGNFNQEHYFKHWKELEDCPIKTKGKYSQLEINRMKYNGVRESIPHIEIKNHLYEYLLKHPACTELAKEKVIKSLTIKGEWKKPDVSLKINNLPTVIEIQLSTTYLDVIVERDMFYENNQIFIMWVFNEKEISRFRFTEKDIFYDNNRNSFLVTPESRKFSEERGSLHLFCYYQKPYFSEGLINDKWEKKLVSINDLKFDFRKYKIYYHDYEVELQKTKEQLTKYIAKEFEKYWLSREKLSSTKQSVEDSSFINRFGESNIQIEEISSKLAGILNALYSAKHGHVIGYKFSNLVGLSNFIMQQRPEFTFIYLWALAIFGRKQEVEKAPSFVKKVKEFKANRPDQNHEFNRLVEALFPALSQHLQS